MRSAWRAMRVLAAQAPDGVCAKVCLTEPHRVRPCLSVPLISYFRALLFIYTLLVFGELASVPLTMNSLPESIRKFAEEQWKEELPDEQAGPLALVSLGTLAAMVISLVGLAVLWRPARQLFTIYLLLIAIGVVLSGTTVQSELTSVLSFMNTIVAGLILGMIYFSPLRDYFDKLEPDEQVTTGESRE